jgi:signal transduction histidine kinase
VTLASLRVTDRQGVIVATTGSDLGRSLAGWNEVARVLAGEPIFSGMQRRNPAQPVPGGISRTSGVRVFVALPVAAPGGAVAGAVVLSRTPNSLVDTVSGKRYELSVLFLLLIAGGAALAAGIRGWSHELWRWLWPRLRRSRVPMPDHAGTREVAELSDAIASMARTLQTRADYIRSFAASVSHEFKTPMAAIKAAAELLDDHGETIPSEERRHLTALVFHHRASVIAPYPAPAEIISDQQQGTY